VWAPAVFPFLLVTLTLLVQKTVTGGGLKEPDISLAYVEIENMSFLVGEIGYSDSKSFAEQHVQNWLRESQGQACHILYLSNYVGSDRSRRQC
jgi:hypothetical protein